MSSKVLDLPNEMLRNSAYGEITHYIIRHMNVCLSTDTLKQMLRQAVYWPYGLQGPMLDYTKNHILVKNKKSFSIIKQSNTKYEMGS